MDALLALYRYWIYAEFLKGRFLQTLEEFKLKETVELYGGLGVLWFLQTAPGIYQAYWYGTLYVVIEGYKELKLKEPEIDNLLESPNVDSLRLFRNGTFHFQTELISEKLYAFFDSEDSVEWVKSLHGSFGNVIFNNLISQLPESERPRFLAKLKDVTTALMATTVPEGFAPPNHAPLE